MTIPNGEIFTINNSVTYPKYKIEGGYIDIRDRIKRMGDILYPIRLMTDEEIKIVFDGATIQEAKEMVKEILKDFL